MVWRSPINLFDWLEVDHSRQRTQAGHMTTTVANSHPTRYTTMLCYGCGPNSCSISRAISMLFCEMWRARIANIWSNPSPTSCSSCRSVSTPHRAEFSLFASWLSRSLRCGGGDDETFTSCEELLLELLLVAADVEDLSSVCTALASFPLQSTSS